VVEISSSDDEIQLLGSDDDKDDDDGIASGNEIESVDGSHANDELNRHDAVGRVLVNIGHPPEESDIFLPPQIAAAVKPHQVN